MYELHKSEDLTYAAILDTILDKAGITHALVYITSEGIALTSLNPPPP